MKLNEKNESNDFSPRYGYNGIEDRHSNKSLNTNIHSNTIPSSKKV